MLLLWTPAESSYFHWVLLILGLSIYTHDVPCIQDSLLVTSQISLPTAYPPQIALGFQVSLKGGQDSLVVQDHAVPTQEMDVSFDILSARWGRERGASTASLADLHSDGDGGLCRFHLSGATSMPSSVVSRT